MKICILCNQQGNNLNSDYILKFGKLLESVGVNVIVIADTEHYAFKKAQEVELSIIPIETSDGGLTFKSTYSLNKALKKEVPDALIVCQKENISAAAFLKKSALPKNSKLIYLQTEIFSKEVSGFWSGIKDSFWSSKMLKQIDLWITPLAINLMFNKENLPIDESKMTYLFPSIHLDNFLDTDALKASLQIPQDETLIGIIEGTEENATVLIETIDSLRKDGCMVNGMILLNEKGRYSAKRLALYQQVIDLKLEDHIEIFSSDQLTEQQFIHISDILLLPEMSVFKSLEAFAAGTLLIVSKCAASEKLIENGDLGLFSNFEPKQLSEKINEYLDDVLMADILSEKGKKQIDKSGGETTYVKRFLELLADNNKFLES
ncbi:MAG: hypothetical protein CMO01_26155 [Thalassobius sp.]|nr:hypothetical protein [Thalassovita sp.]